MKKLVPSQSEAVWRGEQCIQHSSDDRRDITASWPTLTLILAGEEDEQPFALHIPPCRYLAKAPAKECKDGRPGHAFAIESEEDEGVILGQVVYESFYVVPRQRAKQRSASASWRAVIAMNRVLDKVKVVQDDVLIRAKGLTAMHADEEQVEDSGVGLEEAAGAGRDVDVAASGSSERRWGIGWFVVACVLLVVWLWGWRRLQERKMHGGWGRGEYQRISEGEDELLNGA